MSFAYSFLTPPRAEREEMIDSLEPSDEDFAASFQDVARVNRFLGGTAAVLSALKPFFRDFSENRPVRILDIATGSADIPRAITETVRRGRFGDGRRIEITAIDNHPKVLAFARSQTPANQFPEIDIREGNAFDLPYRDGAFDIALCSLAFHHFGFERCVALLREMERVTDQGFIVNDLLRDRIACGLIWALTRVVGANRLTQHDAPLSVLRAYTRQEYSEMLQAAGIPGKASDIRIYPMYRAVITRQRSGDAHAPERLERIDRAT